MKKRTIILGYRYRAKQREKKERRELAAKKRREVFVVMAWIHPVTVLREIDDDITSEGYIAHPGTGRAMERWRCETLEHAEATARAERTFGMKVWIEDRRKPARVVIE